MRPIIYADPGNVFQIIVTVAPFVMLAIYAYLEKRNPKGSSDV